MGIHDKTIPKERGVQKHGKHRILKKREFLNPETDIGE
jgi:hypothetical protein